MNPLGSPDAYLADMATSVLVCSLGAVSALLSLGLIAYLAMMVELLKRPVQRVGRP